MERVSRMGDVAFVLLVPRIEGIEVDGDVAREGRIGGPERFGRARTAACPHRDGRAVGGVDRERDAGIEYDAVAEPLPADRGDVFGCGAGLGRCRVDVARDVVDWNGIGRHDALGFPHEESAGGVDHCLSVE